jgi:cytochrome c-type biogenesis protein CcmH/NrfG
VLDPRKGEAWKNLGAAYEGLGDYTRAELACWHALSIDPCGEETNFRLARMHVLQGLDSRGNTEREGIVCRLHLVLSINPAHDRAHRLLRQLNGER